VTGKSSVSNPPPKVVGLKFASIELACLAAFSIDQASFVGGCGADTPEDACGTGKSRIIHQMGQRVEWLCSFRRDDRLAQALLEDIPALLVLERIGWQRLLVDLLVQGRIGRNSAQ
jgi:hypothetical protein